jgi:two-component system, NarL family, invasion response regulator UvrY
MPHWPTAGSLPPYLEVRQPEAAELNIARKAVGPRAPRRGGSVLSDSCVPVMTVDDHAAFRSAAREVIEATPGFQPVGEAASGEEALVLVDKVEPQLVLLDVRLPGVDGPETARRLHAAHPEVVVVLISVDELPGLPSSAAESGAVEFVRKQDFGPTTLRGLWREHGRA